MNNNFVVDYVRSKDKYGRYIAVVKLNDVDINAEMLRAGFAWHYAKYDDNFHYAKLMYEAVGHKRGLWKDKNLVMPEKFRQFH